jgi:hypothetical protein
MLASFLPTTEYSRGGSPEEYLGLRDGVRQKNVGNMQKLIALCVR